MKQFLRDWLMGVLSVFLVLQIQSCKSSADCVPQQTRCLNNAAQICNADKSWQGLTDCNRTMPKSVCVMVSDNDVSGHTCVLDGGK